MASLSLNKHRPWPVPPVPHAMTQKWHDLLFMHWRVRADGLRSLIPSGLEIDTCDGSAWVGVVPFRMTGIRMRRMPPVPGTSAFAELNVRTYVTAGGKPGVWFFSLEAASALAVAAARHWFHLPYFRAQIAVAEKPGGVIDYRCSRSHRGAPAAGLRVAYKPTGEILSAQPDSIEYFLTERYCLYAFDGQRIFRGEIDHAPWPLQPAEAEVRHNTMAAASGITLPNEKALLYYAKFQDVRIWGLNQLEG
ncbi:MAG TPA: DUF2071 domain-containing protein [Candidatus Acidoferrum sp.]|nr:DUF2071 domain-containing protein [Candidatus Acidoferrum sp.]